MALRFNPPPNWPAPPDGFVPPAGWQPDPAWGPAPEGWQLWVDDASASSAPAVASAPAVSSAADPAWAPTQAVSTSSTPVADPTGQQVSAPSADYSAASGFSAPAVASAPEMSAFQAPTQPMGFGEQQGMQPPAQSGPAPMTGASAPMAGSAPMMGASAPMAGGSAPMAASAPSSSPYSASLDYAQSPTPYQGGAAQPGFGAQPQAASWQPLDVNGAQSSGSKPVTKQWWFWTIIVVVVLALVGVLAWALIGGGDDPKPNGQHNGQATQQATQQASNGPAPTAKPTGGCQQGTSQNCPGDLRTQSLTLTASSVASDPDATVDVSFGDVVWDATDQLRSSWKYGFVEPSNGYVYMRLPVTVTYHGKGDADLISLTIKYVRDGNTFTKEYTFVSDELDSQTDPYDGGSVTGYVTFLIPAEYAHSGAFVISYNYHDEYWMAEL